ncbi:MAG: GTP-binding protein [Chromatiales bacterium]|nr:GTP-binding protein [Chromatiales bacterium]
MPADPGLEVPLTLLTGFLGAGKTTVLNRILSGDHGLRVTVLVNDFGDLDIAEELVAGRSGDTINLTNGCVCCSLKEDLASTVLGALAQAPDHLLLEASGVADPTGIATTLLAPVFAGRVRLDGVICVTDACLLPDPPEPDLVLRQLMVSDLVLLNKADLAGPARMAAASEWIRTRLAGARIVPARHGDVPLPVLLSSLAPPGERALPVAQPEDCAGEACDHPGHQAHPAFDTWYFRNPAQFDAGRLEALGARLPPAVYRVKGVVNLAGSGTGTALLQGVGRRIRLEPLPADNPGGNSRLVVIGAAGGLDPDWLEQAFSDCLAAN